MTIQNNNNKQGLCPSQLWGFDPNYSKPETPCFGVGLKRNQRTGSYSKPTCQYYTSGHSLPDRLILQHSASGVTTDFFSPPTVFIASSGAVSPGQQGESYPAGLSHGFSHPLQPKWVSPFPLVIVISQGNCLLLNWGFLCARCMKSKMLMINPRNCWLCPL